METVKVMIPAAKQELGFSGNGRVEQRGTRYILVLELGFPRKEDAEEVLGVFHDVSLWANDAVRELSSGRK